MTHPLALKPAELQRLIARGLIIPAPPKRWGDWVDRRMALRQENRRKGLTVDGKPRQRNWTRCGNGGTREYHNAYMKKWRANRKSKIENLK